jgi:DNA-binding LytR/AlgR family response regulator
MNVLIVEDEQMAADRLKTLLRVYDPQLQVLAQTDSVKKSAAWLMNNPPPDLIFMDIQLGDGISFEIFELVSIQSPVIFTTAYNEYAIQAFKVNSVDYLLKPLDKESLFRALDKYRQLFGQRSLAPAPELNLAVLKRRFLQKPLYH